QALAEHFRGRRILMPSADVFEAICAEAATRAMRRIYSVLTERLTAIDRHSLDALLSRRGETKTTTLTWVRQPPGAPSPTNLLEHIDRMKALEAIELPVNIAHGVHQNRLLKI